MSHNGHNSSQHFPSKSQLVPTRSQQIPTRSLHNPSAIPTIATNIPAYSTTNITVPTFSQQLPSVPNSTEHDHNTAPACSQHDLNTIPNTTPTRSQQSPTGPSGSQPIPATGSQPPPASVSSNLPAFQTFSHRFTSRSQHVSVVLSVRIRIRSVCSYRRHRPDRRRRHHHNHHYRQRYNRYRDQSVGMFVSHFGSRCGFDTYAMPQVIGTHGQGGLCPICGRYYYSYQILYIWVWPEYPGAVVWHPITVFYAHYDNSACARPLRR